MRPHNPTAAAPWRFALACGVLLLAAETRAVPLSAGFDAAQDPPSKIERPADASALVTDLSSEALNSLLDVAGQHDAGGSFPMSRMEPHAAFRTGAHLAQSTGDHDPASAALPYASMRSLVNVLPGSTPAGTNGPTQTSAAPVGPWLGQELNQWVHDAIEGMMNSALRLDVTNQGRVSFSLFGLGEFGLTVSGDRSAVALTFGDSEILSARNTVATAGGPVGAVSGGGGDLATPWTGGQRLTSTSALEVESPLRRVMELVEEVITHPLMVMVGILTLAYALLWSILSRRQAPRAVPERAVPRPRSRRHKRSRRGHTHKRARAIERA